MVKLLAYHDRSDGGLLACIAEMAFASHCGISMNVDMIAMVDVGSRARLWGCERTGRNKYRVAVMSKRFVHYLMKS